MDFVYIGNQFLLLSRFVLFYDLFSKNSCSGLSLHSQILYLISNFLHLLYDGFYRENVDYLLLLSNLIVNILVIAFIYFSYWKTYDKKHDTFNFMFAIIASIFLSFIATPKMTKKAYFWTSSLWIDIFAILAQLILFQRTIQTTVISKSYIACLGLQKIFLFIDIVVHFDKESINFYTISILIQSLIYSDFVYEYIVGIFYGSEQMLPL